VAEACGGAAGQDDQIVMGWFTKDTAMNTLTETERVQLHRLEATVEAGVSATLTVIEAGKALAAIRTRQLYRDTAASWDQYVETRFKITRRRADQLVSFAGVQDALQAFSEKTGTAVPEMSERAIRPLVGMDADTIRVVVAEAAGEAEGVTPATIRKAAARRRPKAVKVPRPVRLKVAGAVVEIALNVKGVKAGVTVEAALVAALEAVRRQAAEAA